MRNAFYINTLLLLAGMAVSNLSYGNNATEEVKIDEQITRAGKMSG